MCLFKEGNKRKGPKQMEKGKKAKKEKNERGWN